MFSYYCMCITKLPRQEYCKNIVNENAILPKLSQNIYHVVKNKHETFHPKMWLKQLKSEHDASAVSAPNIALM